MILQCEPLIGEAEREAVNRYMASGGFLTEYKVTEEFEKKLTDFLQVPYVSTVPNGSSALLVSLLASGIGTGDEVLVPDYTMVATVGAVRMTGATPVLVDIDRSLCMDVSKAKVTDKTKALIYVEVNGRTGGLDRVKDFCQENNLVLIEDSCQALGSKHNNNNKYLGTFGRFGCFSFSFHKLISSGQGGAIISHTKEDYETIERWKDHGSIGEWTDTHNYFGFNFCFTDLQSAVLLPQLEHIEERIEKKRNLHRWYFDEEPAGGYVPWFMEYYTDNKDHLLRYLRDEGIVARSFYPPIHTQKIYQNAYCPVTEERSSRGIWLPSSLTLSKEQVDYVKGVLKRYADI